MAVVGKLTNAAAKMLPEISFAIALYLIAGLTWLNRAKALDASADLLPVSARTFKQHSLLFDESLRIVT
jgi:hypothetical protein